VQRVFMYGPREVSLWNLGTLYFIRRTDDAAPVPALSANSA
jgi:hypothetical protein